MRPEQRVIRHYGKIQRAERFLFVRANGTATAGVRSAVHETRQAAWRELPVGAECGDDDRQSAR